MSAGPAERWIDARELAETMGVSLATVTRWTRAGVPSQTWGMRVRRYRLSEVVAWRQAQAASIDNDPSPGRSRRGPAPTT